MTSKTKLREQRPSPARAPGDHIDRASYADSAPPEPSQRLAFEQRVIFDGDGKVFESDLPAGTTPTGMTVAGTLLDEAALTALSPTSPVSVGNTLNLTSYDAQTGAIDYVYRLQNREDHSSGPVVDAIPILHGPSSGFTPSTDRPLY